MYSCLPNGAGTNDDLFGKAQRPQKFPPCTTKLMLMSSVKCFVCPHVLYGNASQLLFYVWNTEKLL